MCFSATASFVASGILGVIGLLAYKQVTEKKQLLFSSIPILFSLQQAAEGVVWLSFNTFYFEPWRFSAAYVFLFFAFMVWPILIPLSIYFLAFIDRSWYMLSMIGGGILISSYLAINLWWYDIIVDVLHCHIYYSFFLLQPAMYVSTFLYLCVTVLPFFYTPGFLMRFFGLLFALSYGISYVFYSYVFISVWCFFSALLSIGVVIILYRKKWDMVYDTRHRS